MQLIKLEMDLISIKDAFDRVAKKQKLSSSKAQEVIDKIHQGIEQALKEIQSIQDPDSQADHKSILTLLKNKLTEIAPVTQWEGTQKPVTQLEGNQKELNIALSKYPKLLEKSLNPDISKAYRNVEFDIHAVNQIIASHFYRQGLFDIGDCFVSEAKEPEGAAAMKLPFLEMYQMLEAIKSQNLEPALNWAANNLDKLKENGSDLELKLHGMQFMEILRKGSRDEALMYARTHLSPFASSHMVEIQKFMACLLWSGRLDKSPYSELLSPTNWDKLAGELIRQFCSHLGQAFERPLSVTIAAGAQGLPPLLKFMNVMVGKKLEWQSMKQLPVPVELDSEFQFHSVFVCPVSKEQATEDNPPMLMSCGHALCRQSIMKMSKSSTKSFKCPYCPSYINATECRQLYF